MRPVLDRVVVTSALVVAALNAVAALAGAWRWWRGREPGRFWVALRVAQAAAVAFAALAGVLRIAGHEPHDGLFWLYALLPLAVAVIAEQLRAASAQTVLDARGLENARAMEGLDGSDQRAIVLEILRREMGVMTCAAAVVVFLALRAAGTASGF